MTSTRRLRLLTSTAAALLLLGGAAAVAAGTLDQHAGPDPPPGGASQTLGAAPTRAPSVAPSTSRPDPAHRPVRIRIPAIQVGSELTTVGLRPDGSLAVPKPGLDYDKAAWFRGSPMPGDQGPAVIEGHVDGNVHGPSVFYHLGELTRGDHIVVTRRDGTRVRFVVDAVRLYRKARFPTFAVYGNTRGPELRLITCGGRFDSDRAVSGYTGNVVVFARQGFR